MELGAVYPQIELRGDPDAVRTIGQAVEDLGYDHLLAYDHVLGAVPEGRSPAFDGPYTERDPFHDPFVLFAYLAGRTQRLRFTSGILILPQRQTALVAKQAADLAVLSGGRFRLGVGVGWNEVEYDALGQDFSTRGARCEEQIGLLRRLWTEPVVDFEGRFDRVDRAGILPRPSAAIPIWIGGFVDRAYRRAARLADGFIFSHPGDELAEQWGRLQEVFREENRSLDGFGAEVTIGSRQGVDDVARRIEQWEELGGTHASVISMGLGLDSAQAHIEYFAQVAAAMGRG